MKAIDNTYRISSEDGVHLCDASFKIRLHNQRDGKIEGLVYITLLSAVPNSVGKNTKDEISFGWVVEDNSARSSWIEMDISEQLRNRGIGTFIWYVVYESIPEYLKDNFIVSGKLSPQDAPEPRDSFWRKLLCFDSNPQFKYNLKESGWGYFQGRLCSKNLQHFPKIEVSII